MVTHHHVRRLLGHTVHCHTPYGTIHGVIVHCTKRHLYLAVVPAAHHTSYENPQYFNHQRPMGQGPTGPGGPPGNGDGWHMAIPLVAILGITAVGLHWW